MEIKALASGSKGNAYLVSDGLSPLLLDCGIHYREIQRGLNFQTTALAGCLLTHEHQDHAKAAADLAKAGVDIYASRGTFDALGLNGHRMHMVRAREQFNLPCWTVLPFETAHDAAEPLGFLVVSPSEKLLYLTDTMYCKYRFQGLTHVMVECNYSADLVRENVEGGTMERSLKNRVIRSHFSLENVKGFLRANDLSRVQEIWLLHLSDNNSDEAQFKAEIQSLTGKPVYIA